MVILLALGLLGSGTLPDSSLESSIDAYLRTETEQKKFSGVVLIAKDGKALFRGAYWYADSTTKMPNTPETAFLIFSNTMQFTAAAILMLRDAKKLATDDAISKHLSDCPPEWDGIKLHHLLSHTSGIEIDNLWAWI